MSHKDKICNTAVLAHIESCHPQCSYVPLVVSRSLFRMAQLATSGLRLSIELEIDRELGAAFESLDQQAVQLQEKFVELGKSNEEVLKTGMRAGKKSVQFADVISDVLPAFDLKLNYRVASVKESLRKEFVASSGVSMDITKPTRAIEARIPAYRQEVAKVIKDVSHVRPIPVIEYLEVDQLGLFFTESVCYRCEGLTYEPCGEEHTIMPGEKFSYSNTLTVTEKDASNSKETTSQVFTTKDSFSEEDTFESSYERKLKKETDIKASAEAGFKIPFKKLPISVKLNGSVNFNTVVDEASKSSSKFTRKRFHEVEQELKSTTSIERSYSQEVERKVAYQRVWENKTDKPQTYIRRQTWCKTSVIHKRTNVQLAWSGCIEQPGRDLCTPDNIEARMEPTIKAIREKWSQSSAPSEFGQRPANQSRRIDGGRYSDWQGESINDLFLAGSIPSGFTYFGNAAVEVYDNTTAVESAFVKEAPTAGATGGVQFIVEVNLENKWAHQEKAKFSVVFEIAPLAAQEWDKKVEAWRKSKADEEIAKLLQEKKEELNMFLASEQAHAAIIRRIMEDYFSVSTADSCCELIKRLHKLFDFENLCFTIYPAWNASGTGCQASQPPTIYTASCLSFFLPIFPGMESEAFAMLGAIGAIPWSTDLLSQYAAYALQAEQMRDTLYERAFNPSGWSEKFDKPYGYHVTPYNTNSPDEWSADHETSLNYEVIDAFTITTPCGGFRIDPRPMLCG